MDGSQWVGSTAYLRPGQGDTWAAEAATRNAKGSQRILFAGPTDPPSGIAETLGQQVVMRRRMMLLDDQPVEITDSYWPADIASGTALAERGRIRGGAVTLLAELGYTPTAVDEHVTTRPPSDIEVEHLGLAPGEWILQMQRVITDAHGRPYEVSVMVSPGRIGRLHYSMKVD